MYLRLKTLDKIQFKSEYEKDGANTDEDMVRITSDAT
jgi:hypothetical protein